MLALPHGAAETTLIPLLPPTSVKGCVGAPPLLTPMFTLNVKLPHLNACPDDASENFKIFTKT